MTDKTIINDVDVSGCDSFYKNLADFNNVCTDTNLAGGTYCNQHPQCHHKEIKRQDERIRELEKQNARLVKALEE